MMCNKEKDFIVLGNAAPELDAKLFERMEESESEAIDTLDTMLGLGAFVDETDEESMGEDNKKDLANQVFQPHNAGSSL